MSVQAWVRWRPVWRIAFLLASTTALCVTATPRPQSRREGALFPAPTDGPRVKPTSSAVWDFDRASRADLATAHSGLESGSDLGTGLTAETEDPPVKLKWKPKKLGNGTGPSLAVDGEGNPHVVFRKTVNAGYVLAHSWADGAKWFSETVDSNPNLGTDTSIAMDGEGGIHVAYTAYEPGEDWQLRYAHGNGGVWQTEILEAGGFSNSIVVDEEGAAHVLHIDGAFASSNPVRYLKQTSTGWQAESIARGGLYFGGSSLRLHDGQVYATFSDSSLPRKLFLAIREAGSWTVEEIDPGSQGSMEFDQDGILHVVYVAESVAEVKHAWLTGSGWLYETLVSSSAVFGEPLPPDVSAIGEDPALVADATGRLQMVSTLTVTEGNGQGIGLLAASFDGAVWTPSLASARGGYGGNSIAVDPNGIVHISSTKVGGDNDTVVATRLQGTRLSLAVTPEEAGVISVSPTGTVCGGKCTEVLYPGAEVTLTAIPAQGFVFAGWSQSCSGDAPNCELTMDRNLKVKARFEPSPK